ncbi:AraC family transcriptional regulator [Pseudomonas fluorescens]|uniref:AraC family transcriptional regulator n=2 Tax=Pseudomonas TaxID=286 RepID=A0A0G3GLY1_9PSED|nr:AraC family transcriptional regulator [Pseudomonas fluorescens]AKJ99786.1 AraC family transcriptional regulator [Pseudomonas chlororaphis]KIQ56964.1 AraC family transcriptional regulator [Pseudomonas fluorescens]
MSVSPMHSAPDDGVNQRRAELAELMKRFAPQDGVYSTAIDTLNIVRCDQPTDALHVVHKPGLCVIVEGRKEVRLADERYVYDPLNYLVVSVTLPLAGQVVEASPERPYLCVRLDIDPAQICRLIADASAIGVPPPKTGRGLFLDRIDSPLLDAVLRLLRLLDSPDDIATLAPLAQQEIFYRLLRGTQGQRLQEIAIPDTQTHRISRAIEWLNTHYAEPLSIDSLAQMINLSPSALHHRFKAVTAMSPLQYQKQLRLQEARRLLLADNSDVSSIGYKMGYESPSQFSREYSRLFGASPSKDIARLRAQALQVDSA